MSMRRTGGIEQRFDELFRTHDSIPPARFCELKGALHTGPNAQGRSPSTTRIRCQRMLGRWAVMAVMAAVKADLITTARDTRKFRQAPTVGIIRRRARLNPKLPASAGSQDQQGSNSSSHRRGLYGNDAHERLDLATRHEDAETLDFPFELDTGGLENPLAHGLAKIFEIVARGMTDIDHEVAV